MTALHVRRFANPAELDQALTARLLAAIAPSRDAPVPALMLSGGTTPLRAYEAVGRSGTAAAAGLILLWSDERYVPADSPQSNRHNARALVEGIGLPAGQVLGVRTELPLEEAASDYEARLRALLDRGGRIGLGLLGLGADGHTASLFEQAALRRAAGRLAIPVQRPDGMQAVSVTPELLARVEQPLFVVSGGGKFDAIRDFLAGAPGSIAWQALAGCSDVELWLTQSAEWSVYAG